MKISDTAKGIIIGALTCGLLVTSTIFLFAFFNNNNIVDFGGIDGLIKALVPLCIILIITVLLGISIARRIYFLRKVTIISTIAIALVVVSLFIYVIWWIFSQPPPEIIYM